MWSFFKSLDPVIDYRGQDLANKLIYFMMIIGFSVATAVGWFFSDFGYLLLIYIVTIVVSAVVTIPAWPFYRKSPAKFVKVS
ncbi:hypothetical protein EDEG_03625 [Edhazardia aedis USNM 41457]|uniref:Signal peptidase complex subunit 1 n=1 Tax=Edhazardia aedis (strain USNM 41457) TaxID=1003232 RepID=J9D2V3_EDHAE|nr:hypothetical protein EDEG_03625 [Edhazardia aedis USNM 41457]|eukprot:EJW01909.1 hypothetical protein EDEG_03625 [Edhazardia aedis USNM 41457]